MTDLARTPRRSIRRNRLRVVFSSPLDIWSNRPSADLLLSGLAVGGHVLVVYRLHAGNALHWANHPQRLALYAAGAGVMALAAGFTGTAIAQYGSSSGPIISVLRGIHGKAIRRNWLNIVRWLFWCALLCLVAMAVDAPNSPKGSEWIFEAALAVAVCKVIRLVFLFNLILSATDYTFETQNQDTLGRQRDSSDSK